MASLIDLERLQTHKQMSKPAPPQLKTYLSPSLTPQGPSRPMNDKILGNNGALSNSGNVDSRRPPTKPGDNSFIHGRKVDSPKIFLGNKVNDDRPKTQAQQARKIKTKDVKESKKKSNGIRKNGTGLNGNQVVTTTNSFQGKTILNLGLHTNKEVDSRKFDFGLPPYPPPCNGKSQSGQVSAQQKKKASISKSSNSKMFRHQRNFTTTQEYAQPPQVNNFMVEDGGNSSTIEFEPVSKNQGYGTNVSKSSKTIREQRDGYAKVRSSQQTVTGGPLSSANSNSNYQCKSRLFQGASFLRMPHPPTNRYN